MPSDFCIPPSSHLWHAPACWRPRGSAEHRQADRVEMTLRLAFCPRGPGRRCSAQPRIDAAQHAAPEAPASSTPSRYQQDEPRHDSGAGLRPSSAGRGWLQDAAQSASVGTFLGPAKCRAIESPGRIGPTPLQSSTTRCPRLHEPSRRRPKSIVAIANAPRSPAQIVQCEPANSRQRPGGRNSAGPRRQKSHVLWEVRLAPPRRVNRPARTGEAAHWRRPKAFH